MSRFTVSSFYHHSFLIEALRMRRLIVYGMPVHHIHITSVGCCFRKPSGDTKYPQYPFSGSVVISGRFTNACTLLSWQHAFFSASLDV